MKCQFELGRPLNKTPSVLARLSWKRRVPRWPSTPDDRRVGKGHDGGTSTNAGAYTTISTPNTAWISRDFVGSYWTMKKQKARILAGSSVQSGLL
jgi:hypothetical protein